MIWKKEEFRPLKMHGRKSTEYSGTDEKAQNVTMHRVLQDGMDWEYSKKHSDFLNDDRNFG